MDYELVLDKFGILENRMRFVEDGFTRLSYANLAKDNDKIDEEIDDVKTQMSTEVLAHDIDTLNDKIKVRDLQINVNREITETNFKRGLQATKLIEAATQKIIALENDMTTMNETIHEVLKTNAAMMKRLELQHNKSFESIPARVDTLEAKYKIVEQTNIQLNKLVGGGSESVRQSRSKSVAPNPLVVKKKKGRK